MTKHFSRSDSTRVAIRKKVVDGVCFLFGLAVVAGALSQCSGNSMKPGAARKPPMELHLPAVHGKLLSQEGETLIKAAWPAVLAACPGLNEYADALIPKDIDDNFQYASGPKAARVSAAYVVPDTTKVIPPSWGAHGHTCFFEVSRSGTEVLVFKRGCKAVCLGREITEREAAEPLRLPLSPREQ